MKKGRLSSVSRLIQRPETTEGGNHRLGIEFSYTSTHAALFRSFPRSLAHLFLRVAISSLSGSSCTGAFFGTVTTFVDQTMHTHPRDNRFRFSNVGGQERGNRRGAGRSNSPPCCVFTPGISSKVGFPTDCSLAWACNLNKSRGAEGVGWRETGGPSQHKGG